MKYFIGIVLAVLLSTSAPAYAGSLPASDASIHKLLEILQARRAIDNMFEQMKTIMEQAALQATGRPLDMHEQQILKNSLDKTFDLLHEQVTWSKLEPEYTDIYRKNFSQEQIDDLIKLYQSPIGQVMILKMPEVLQESMQLGESHAKVVMPQIHQINHDMINKLAEYEAKKGKPFAQN